MDMGFLAEKNPWWKGKEHFDEDADYRSWSGNPVRWVPGIVERIEFLPFSLHIILGPRQSGKTTATKLMIRKLLEKTGDPRAVFYFRCDVIKDYKELLELLEMYLNYRDDLGIKTSYLFLDEITMPEEWFRAVKELIDSGKLKNDVLVLTGSMSMKLRKEIELFPGRRGHGKDFAHLTLSFREFVMVMNPELHAKIPALKGFRGMRKASMACVPYAAELNRMFELYLKTGGFPPALISWKRNGYVDDGTRQAYLSWIRNDLHKAGKEESIAKEVLRALLAKMPGRISWEGISREISVKSPKTVNSYLHAFSEMFLAHISYFIDPDTGLSQFGKNKKISFIDPLTYEVVEEWCLAGLKDREPTLVEGIVASHISRFTGEVHYWANGTEVDSVARENGGLVGFEVKWREKAEAKRLVVGRMKEVFVLSKKTFDAEKGVVPVSVFLAMLE